VRSDAANTRTFTFAAVIVCLRSLGADRNTAGIEDIRYYVSGDLAIRDVTREVRLEAEYGGGAKDPWGNERIGFAAKVSIDRKDVGLKWNQLLEAGGVLVGDQIDIDVDLEAVRATTQKSREVWFRGPDRPHGLEIALLIDDVPGARQVCARVSRSVCTAYRTTPASSPR
jgi:hypothetical protein